jgi:PleD family two-component response regulator
MDSTVPPGGLQLLENCPRIYQMAGETILLVKDHDAVTLGLNVALSQERFKVVGATTSAQASKSVNVKKP